jgi:hypothetical protein
MPITEARNEDSRLALVRKLLAKAEATDAEPERDALVERAATLMAKYGIDRAMLAAAGTESDAVIDKVIFVTRPFAKEMTELLRLLAYALHAGGFRDVEQWDESPGMHVGRNKGAFKHGLRLFAHESDMQRLEMLYASLRNQALAGMTKIKGKAQFGQDQRAHRESYLEGFVHGAFVKVKSAEERAAAAREAEQQSLADRAMLEGLAAPASVALVMVGRKSAVSRAIDMADGITPEMRARWDARDARERADRLALEEKYRSGELERPAPPKQRRVRMPRASTYDRVGAYYGDGYQAGKNADTGQRAGSQVRNRKQGEIQ